MKLDPHDGCVCPRCGHHIPELFYCLGCGYVPAWREIAQEAYDVNAKAA